MYVHWRPQGRQATTIPAWQLSYGAGVAQVQRQLQVRQGRCCHNMFSQVQEALWELIPLQLIRWTKTVIMTFRFYGGVQTILYTFFLQPGNTKGMEVMTRAPATSKWLDNVLLTDNHSIYGLFSLSIISPFTQPLIDYRCYDSVTSMTSFSNKHFARIFLPLKSRNYVILNKLNQIVVTYN